MHTYTHTVEQLNNKCADSSKWPYSGVTFLESTDWPVQHMIKVVTSQKTNTEVNDANKN